MEYLLELHEFHRSRVEQGSTYPIKPGDVVTIYNEGQPRGLWRLGKVESLIQGADGITRGVCLRVSSRKGSSQILRRPLQHIYPLEVCHDESVQSQSSPLLSEDNTETDELETRRHPQRKAAKIARDGILGSMYTQSDSDDDES